MDKRAAGEPAEGSYDRSQTAGGGKGAFLAVPIERRRCPGHGKKPLIN
jgi:hypothetical protein